MYVSTHKVREQLLGDFFFPFNVGSRDGTEVIRLCGKHFYLLGPLYQPMAIKKKKKRLGIMEPDIFNPSTWEAGEFL